MTEKNRVIYKLFLGKELGASKTYLSQDEADIVLDIINRQKAKLDEANYLICELCEKCGENVCKNGEECDWEKE